MTDVPAGVTVLPSYGVVRAVNDRARVVLAANPGPMTLTGTNSYLLAAPAATGAVVVDPGPEDADHLDRLAEAGPIGLILLTHRHADHVAGAAELRRRTGAPVRAFDTRLCQAAEPLHDGELIEASGVWVTVWHTPGHTSDSACFLLHGTDGKVDAVLTGDTVLGAGTTVIDHPDGRVRDHLDSLARLAELGGVAVLPGHGPTLPDLAAVCRAHIDHRDQRLAEVAAALRDVGPDASIEAITDAVYADIPPGVRPAAEQSVAAQLAHLRS